MDRPYCLKINVKERVQSQSYLKSLAELVTHDVVQQWVDAGGEEVEHTGRVIKYPEVVVEGIPADAYINQVQSVDGHQSLGVEGSPAEEEGDGYSYCKYGQDKERIKYPWKCRLQIQIGLHLLYPP